MNPQAIDNIKAAFEANPDLQQVYANEFGHCFTKPVEGFKLVKREELDSLGQEEPADGNGGGNGDVTPEKMTVAQLKEKLTELNVAFDAAAKKADLVALLVENLK